MLFKETRLDFSKLFFLPKFSLLLSVYAYTLNFKKENKQKYYHNDLQIYVFAYLNGRYFEYELKIEQKYYRL